MSLERTWPVFHITQAGILSRRSCWLLLAGGAGFAWLAPLATPWKENPVILAPARAQAAWIYAWIALFTWLPFQATAFGHRLRVDGLLEHMRAAGQPTVSICLQITCAVVVWMVALGLLASVVAVAFCLPGHPQEAVLWIEVVLQYFALYALTAVPLLLLAVALGTRTSEVIAFLVPVGLLFTGLIGGAWLGPALADSHSSILKALWLSLPHYHLADLTPRLVFKMGPLPAQDFLLTVACLGLQGTALSFLGIWMFRTRS